MLAHAFTARVAAQRISRYMTLARRVFGAPFGSRPRLRYGQQPISAVTLMVAEIDVAQLLHHPLGHGLCRR